MVLKQLLRAARSSKLVWACLWVVSVWIAYWSGYWGGFLRETRGEYAVVAASVLYDINLLRDIRMKKAKMYDVKRSLALSIETDLVTLSGMKKILDGGDTLSGQISNALYATPKMAFDLRQNRGDRPNLDVSEIELRYRQMLEGTK